MLNPPGLSGEPKTAPLLQARKKSMASEKPKLITSHNQNSFLEKKVLKENLP